MSDICKLIGQNIRQVRRIRHMSMSDVADAINEQYGVVLTASIIGAWERGERRISADHLFMISRVLSCSVYILYGISSDAKVQVGILSDHERQIIDYLFNDWPGDTHALIEMMGMYMTSDRDTRAEMATICLDAFKRSVQHGMHQSAGYQVNTDYLRKKCHELEK